MGCFSFHPRKAVTTGEGGVVTTDDPALARKLRALRNHGLDPDSATADFILAGFNYRMTEFQAAMGQSQMSKVERIIAARQAGASRYGDLLGRAAITPPNALPDARHVFQSYVTLLPAQVGPKRPEIIRGLRERGVEATIGTYHIPLTTYYRGRLGVRVGDFPVTDDVAMRALSLPLSERLSPDQQRQVVAALQEQLAESGLTKDFG
jgi:perosamine synthetase